MTLQLSVRYVVYRCTGAVTRARTHRSYKTVGNLNLYHRIESLPLTSYDREYKAASKSARGGMEWPEILLQSLGVAVKYPE